MDISLGSVLPKIGRMPHCLLGILLALLISSAGCVSYKAVPPCAESDGAVAYTQEGAKRTDGLFLNWQCFERMKQDLNACYDTAK